MMNKLPAKQIYLLSIIVLGIITLSVYSTYSIFTLEAESSDIVSIHTPSNLSVASSRYEYQKINVPKNSYVSTDIDIYNNLDYPECYSIWYKIATQNIDKDKIKIYQNTDASLLTSGTVDPVATRRVNLFIINDNDVDINVNVGLSHTPNGGTCELNLTSDKLMITEIINNPKALADTLIKETTAKNVEAGYLTYKDIEEDVEIDNEDKIYVSKEIDYHDEMFTLKEPKEIANDELNKYHDYYTCLTERECQFAYHITETKAIDESDTEHYKIVKYDRLVGYLASEVGLRKVTTDSNDFYFYGDNPNNFIYYNCEDEKDLKTCELWRIVGFTYDSKTNKYLTKIIRNDYLDAYKYDDDTNSWDNSTISKELSEYKLKDTSLLTEITFREQNVANLESNLNSIPKLNKEYKAKVTLLNLADYLHTSSCTKQKINEYDEACLKNNWLNTGNAFNEWTMTIKYEEPYKDEENDELITPDNDKLYSVGNTIEETKYDEELNVRPVIYLKSRTLFISGDGSLDKPYIIR